MDLHISYTFNVAKLYEYYPPYAAPISSFFLMVELSHTVPPMTRNLNFITFCELCFGQASLSKLQLMDFSYRWLIRTLLMHVILFYLLFVFLFQLDDAFSFTWLPSRAQHESIVVLVLLHHVTSQSFKSFFIGHAMPLQLVGQ